MDEEILLVIAEALDFEREEVYPEASLKNDLIIDSLDYIVIIMALEDAFGIELLYKDILAEFKTVRDIIEYIKKEKA